ncbi:hypothetical protein [Marinococcus halotolerans]|uniref:hypothetical protein n=1 Tax=Marinococcus halotolerans TaxID=301092 RepID=UPI0003B336F2|nr:hypothetical protein [Marinococcus halotolerans]
MKEYRLTRLRFEHSQTPLTFDKGLLTVYDYEPAEVWYVELENPHHIELFEEMYENCDVRSMIFYTERNSARIGKANVTRVLKSSGKVSVSIKGEEALKLVGS